MAKSVNTPKEEVKVETPIVETPAPVIVEEVSVVEPIVEPVVEVKPASSSFNKEEIVAKLSELASIFRNLYGEQLNPVFAEIHKSLSNAQYKIMQNL